jgi:RNA-directed DNA polymerase
MTAYISKIKFLGYSFYVYKGVGRLRVHPKSIAKMKERIRMIIWKQWKRLRTRGRNLMKLGIIKYKAWEYANTRKGYWRTAGSAILSRSVTSDRLRHAGFIFGLFQVSQWY